MYYFYSVGKTMISEGGDGFRQHYRALLYYADYLKELINGFLKGSFSIPQWDFAIGEGADPLLTFHLHAIGDIFAFFSFLCPDRYMYLYFDGITLARMYCSGLFFIMLCVYKGKSRRYAILPGALLYAFSTYSVTCMFNHTYFIAAAVYLPLIILGIEKIINDDRPYLLTIAVMLSSLSNFYFFYMNVVSTVVFVAVRLLFIRKSFKDRLMILLKIALYSFTGLMMSAVIFMPMLKAMLNNSRMNAPVQYDPLFSLDEYRLYFVSMTFYGTYCGGFSFLWIPAFTYQFAGRRKPVLLALLITAFLFECIPFLSSAYHAFTYPTDRWVYAVSLLVAFVITDSLEDLEGISRLLPINLILVVLYYGACVYLDPELKMMHILLCLISIVLLLFIRFVRMAMLHQLACVGSIVFFLALEMFFLFGPNYWCYPKDSISIHDISEKTAGEYEVFDDIKDDSFFRYSGYSLSENANIHGDYSSTQHYWSIVNNNIVGFRTQLAYSDSSLHHFRNYGERFSQNALSGVKYYINKENNRIPYGFDYIDTINGFDIYRSDYALSLLYAYDNYIPADDWKKLEAVSKNEALVQAVLTEKEPDGLVKKEIRYDHEDIPYTMQIGAGISIESNVIRVSESGAGFYLDTKHLGKGEYYVSFTGLDSDQVTTYVTVTYKDIKSAFVFKGHDNEHYMDRHDYIVNLGYLDEIDGTISIEFSNIADFTYESICIIYQPLEYQIECLNRLKDLQINSLLIDTNVVSAEVSLQENKLICFSIPYSEGWKAYVDGKKAELLNCNIQYMGVELPTGNHTIELKYSTPLLKEGAMISVLGMIVFVLLIIKKERE